MKMTTRSMPVKRTPDHSGQHTGQGSVYDDEGASRIDAHKVIDFLSPYEQSKIISFILFIIVSQDSSVVER